MPDKPLDIDVAGATAALEAAGIDPVADIASAGGPRDPWQPHTARDEAGKFTSTPQEPESSGQPETPETPAAPAEPTAEEPIAFSQITDEAILSGDVTPEQLAAMRRAMNADYTSKTQEVAPWRKLAQEFGVEAPDQVREALETYQRISDPRNWPELHSELTEYMQQYGMSPREASAAAAEQLANLAPASDAPDLSAFGGDPDDQDPSIAPILNVVQQLQQQVADLTKAQTEQQQAAQQKAQFDAIAAELTRTENEIRAANPHYTDQDIEFLYKLMPGNGQAPADQLKAAQATFDREIGNRVAALIARKEGTLADAPTPVAGGGVIPQEAPKPMTPEEAHQAAMAHVARLDAEDAQ